MPATFLFSRKAIIEQLHRVHVTFVVTDVFMDWTLQKSLTERKVF